MSGYTCAFRGCHSKTGGGVALFSFPKDQDRAKLWLKACCRTDLLSKTVEELSSNYKLCEHHFEDKYYTAAASRKRLLPNASPTLFPEASKRTCEEKELEKAPPKKVSKNIKILSDVTIVRALTKQETFSEQTLITGNTKHPFLDIYGPSTSQYSVCEPISVEVSDKSEKSSELLSPSASTQTSSHLSNTTPRKQKLRRQIRKMRKIGSTTKTRQKHSDLDIDDFNRLCNKFLGEPLSSIIKTHVALKGKKRISHRYSKELKQFALTLHFLSPKAYKFISSLLTLPTKRSLQRLTEKISCKPGVNNPALYKALQIKLDTMLDQDKHCILCIDEMSLKSNIVYNVAQDKLVGFVDIGEQEQDPSICKNALVVMARGLYSPWKQPLTYFLVDSQLKASKLKIIMEELIPKLLEIGLKVEGIASDMGSNFIELARLLGVTAENTEFQLGDQNLLYIFDPCHLIKASRNNLLKHSFLFEGKKTSWTYVDNFYREDKKQFYRCAPKLTDSHLHPSNFEKMKVSLASQVLSHTVASGMNTYITLGALPEDAFGTVEVIEKFNNLFDLLNALSLRDACKFKNVYDGSAFQKEFLQEMLNFLSKLNIVNFDNKDITNTVKFHKCWAITINSTIKLWEKLSTLGYMYLKTRRLNTDCIENFFGAVKQQSGNNINPTPLQFERAFKKLFCQNYLHSENMNCKNDLDSILMSLKSTNIAEIFNEQEHQVVKGISLHNYSYKTDHIPTENAFRYVCGYIVKRALEVHNNCDTCTNFGREYQNLDINRLFLYYRAYNSEKCIYGGLQSPPEEFISYIYKLEEIFNFNFPKICTSQGISNNLFSLMKNVRYENPCPEFPKTYILKLFIRLKIFYTIKYNNRDLKSTKGKKTVRKLKILSHL